MYTFFDGPPEAILIGNAEYKVNTDFRMWLEISEILSDTSLSDRDKILCLLMRGYKDKIPPDINDAIDGLLLFMSQNKKGGKTEKSTPVISFSDDEGVIYASFLQQYGIDLFKENLHWWKFLMLLGALDEKTSFMRIVGYRSVNLENIKDKLQKSFYRKMKNKYRINRDISDSDIADVFEGCC